MAKPGHFEINIPEPCGVPWESMSHVDELKRHCSSCDRVITDFSKMTDDELILMFRYSNGKLCGRFAKSQLDRPLRRLPEKTTFAKWWRTLLLLPLTLFAKPSKAQNLHETMHTKLLEPPDTVLVETIESDSGTVAMEKDSVPQVVTTAVQFTDSFLYEGPPIEYVMGVPPPFDWGRQIQIQIVPTWMWYLPVMDNPVPAIFLLPPSPTQPASLFYSITDSTVFTRRKRKADAVQLDTAVASNNKEQPEQKQAPVSPALSSDEVTLSWWRRKFRV